MTQSFGHRQAPVAPARPAAPPRTPAPAAKPALNLDPRAEAFAAQLAADRGAAPSGFDGWRRSRSGRTWVFWGISLLSVSPGIVSYVMQLPLELTIGLEVAAFVGNIWLRIERRRRLREIVSWEEPEGV
jgi:hypothetical protein